MKPPPRPLLFDQSNSFGWISIALHWATAALIIALWIMGKNITEMPDGSSGFWRTLHMTVGLSAWILLAGRVAWRIYSKHPRSNGLTARTHDIAKTVHYLMLVSLTLLILSGPIVAWLGPLTLIGSAAFVVHNYAGNVLLVLVITHTLAAVKHLMFHQDDSVIRMLWPKQKHQEN
jgi:cytochrome b561